MGDVDMGEGVGVKRGRAARVAKKEGADGSQNLKTHPDGRNGCYIGG